MARETLTRLVARQLEEGNHSDAMKSVTRSFKSGKNSEIDAKFTASSLYMIKKHENRGEQLNRDSIEQLVNNLIDEKLFDVGLSFIDLFKESAYLMELKGRILYGNGDYGGCSRVLAGVVDGTYGETTPTVETSWILGDILFQGKRYESAFNLFSAGLLQAQATKNEKMIELLTCRKSEADLILEEQKEKKKKEQEEKKKDEKIKRIKDGEENKKYDERKKKRNEERQKALEGKGDDIDGEEENKKQGLQDGPKQRAVPPAVPAQQSVTSRHSSDKPKTQDLPSYGTSSNNSLTNSNGTRASNMNSSLDHSASDKLKEAGLQSCDILEKARAAIASAERASAAARAASELVNVNFGSMKIQDRKS